MAWTQAKRLHRDVSAWNILIVYTSKLDTPEGFLNDWDLSKLESELRSPTQHARSVCSLSLCRDRSFR